MIHSKKFDQKYMKLAKAIALENTACHSRKLGVVIVDPNNKVKGIGYNGPPAGTPHPDDPIYIKEYFWPSLTDNEQESIALTFGYKNDEADTLNHLTGFNGIKKGMCPRRFLGCNVGERATLCTCQHAESNALINAACDVSGCVMYCATPIPCVTCTGMIINARIAEVHCYCEMYHEQSIWLFNKANIILVTYDE